MFKGNLEDGKLESGQVSLQIEGIAPAKDMLEQIIQEYKAARERVCQL